jgi:dipeptidyl-peptidase-4
VLLAVDQESIYRRSTIASHFVLNLKTMQLRALEPDHKQSYATFSPDGSMIAFVRDNNLYYTYTNHGRVEQVTADGEVNAIINGAADWVYEEELSLTKAFFWSPDSRKLAYYRFDERDVPLYEMQMWGGIYPETLSFKYPKAGEPNSDVSIHLYDLKKQSYVEVETRSEAEQYIPRLFWLPNASQLMLLTLNRLQNNFRILLANADTGQSDVILQEESDTYVDVESNDEYFFVDDGRSFITTSERDGFRHIYHFDVTGKFIGQLTSGDWEVDELLGYDSRTNLIYYTSSEQSPLQRHLYTITLDGSDKRIITPEKGKNTVNLSGDYSRFIQTNTAADHPEVILLKSSEGALLQTLEKNASVQALARRSNWSTKEFFQFETEEGTLLNGYMLKPHRFDSTRQYPLLMFVYGGPGSQRVEDSWEPKIWHHYLNHLGYMVACVDNRGTGGRGKAFKDTVYKQLGKLEVQDQISAARYLQSLPYIEGDRIGIWGWSYGGFMSSLAILQGADIFKMAIAVAPVTHWRFYDTIYTERYMQRPMDNMEGYNENSPLTHADKLEGAFLLIHGTGDDNVHVQNAIHLQDALIEANKDFQSVFYPNKDHSISGRRTQLHLFRTMTDFVQEHL